MSLNRAQWHCYFANSPHGHRQLPSLWVLLTVSHLDSGAPFFFFFEDPSDDVARVSHSKPEIILAFAPPSDVMFSPALILIFRAGASAPSRCPSLPSRNPNPRRTSWACRGERASGACLISINISLAFVGPPPGLAVLIGRICRAGIPMAISFSTSKSLISRTVLAFQCAPKSK